MTRSETRRLGPYEILELLGAGGMGEVYKARDVRLGRIVAVKLLKGKFSQRFEREARAIAALNHPNICTLYDIGEEAGTAFLVMEYIEGGPIPCPLPLKEAVRLASQIADALIAAHRKGIVHRDLKPGNILLAGRNVKLLDFGLAKTEGTAVVEGSFSSVMTHEGTIQGTLQYMSPEQIAGQEVDKRSDIFAFGLVLFEMLTGRRMFEAASKANLIAAILRDEPPDLSEWVPGIPRAFDRLLRKCLRKNPDDRWQSLEAVRDALEWAAESEVAAPPERQLPATRSRWLAFGLAAIALVLGAVLLSQFLISPEPQTRMQFDVGLPPQLILGFDTLFSLSPDGHQILFNANRSLWIRSLQDGGTRQIPGTNGASLPFWSPDGRQIAFFADGRLKIMALPDGNPEVLCDAPNPKGGSWSTKSEIVFAPKAIGPLYRVPVTGGEPVPVTALNDSRQEDLHSNPVFLPEGERFLYFARSLKAQNNAVFMGSIRGPSAGASHPLLTGSVSGAVYVSPAGGNSGWLLYIKQQNLMAERFNPENSELSGDPVLIARRVRLLRDQGIGNFSVAPNGMLLLVTDQVRISRLNWITRKGDIAGTPGEPRNYLAARLSPNGHQIAVTRREEESLGKDIWILDLERNVDTKVTFDGDADDPVWSPDGTRLAFAWHKDGEEHANLYVKILARPEDPQPLLPTGIIRWPLDWSRDGNSLIYAQIDPTTKFDLWTLGFSNGSTPKRVVRSPGKDNEARFSPDGRLLAYQSDEIVETRIYVRSLGPGGEKIAVSEGHGAEPRWRDDGKELYYIAADGALMAVPISASNPGIKAGRPQRLFGGRDTPILVLHFDPAPGGERFLVLSQTEETESTPVHLLLQWQPATQ